MIWPLAKPAERAHGPAPSSRCEEAAAGWYAPPGPPPHGAWEQRLAERKDPKWDTFSWVTLRVLLEAVNHLIIERAPALIRQRRAQYLDFQRQTLAQLSGDTRGPGGFRPDLRVDWTALSSPRFLIVGDPGEADASQYAVVDPLLEVHRGGAGWEPDRRKKSDFMVVLSDVIYPSGDVNDYLNGFYIPFREYDRPIYALPGNHDWYDGLSGFMYHFCAVDRLPPPAIDGARLADRIAAALWRRAARPKVDALERPMAERDRLNGRRGVQPASYFALELADVRLVAIDTGVNGELDGAQGEWLRTISADSKPKVLLTGKPILTGDRYRPGRIAWGPDAPEPDTTVDDIVRDPAHHFVAAIGGDNHHYQRFPVRIGDRTIHYIVAGGSGAHLSATHMIPTIGPAPEQAAREERPIAVTERDYRCYPLRGDSLALFCRRMGPLLFKLLISALLIAGTAALLVAELIDLDDARRRAAALAAGGAAAVVLLTVAAPRGARRLVVLVAALAGSAAVVIVIADARATAAVAVTLAVLGALVLALVAAYVLRGRLPKVVLDALPAVPLVALPAAIWAPYELGTTADLLLYVVAPACALVVVVLEIARWRNTLGPLRAAMYRAGTALAWLGLAGVTVERFGERWLTWSLVAVLALLAVVGAVVPRLGPGRRRAEPRHDAVGGALGAALAVAGVALVLVGLEQLAGSEASAVAAAGIAAVAGVAAVLVVGYLLRLGLWDPRALRRLRTGRITPRRAAEYVSRTMGKGFPPTRPAGTTRWVPGEERSARIVSRLGRRVSAIADTNEPPFFKSFLSIEVEAEHLVVSCYGVTGYHDPRRSPSLEDRVRIPLTGDGPVTDIQFDCTQESA